MVTNQQIRVIERQIRHVKAALAQLGDLQPGTLYQRFNVCGKPGCRCKADPPRKHGPYYQLQFTRKGKHDTRFVTLKDVATLKRQLKNYAKLKRIVNRWIDLATDLCRLKLKREAP